MILAVRWIALNALLLAAIAGAIGAVQFTDRSSPAVAQSVARYAAALQAQDLQGTEQEIAPSRRAEWEPFIRTQLGNIYEIRGFALRTPSLLDRLTRGASSTPTEATVVMDVNRGYPDQFYQPTTRVKVTFEDGRLYLAEPLLAPESQSPG